LLKLDAKNVLFCKVEVTCGLLLGFVIII